MTVIAEAMSAGEHVYVDSRAAALLSQAEVDLLEESMGHEGVNLYLAVVPEGFPAQAAIADRLRDAVNQPATYAVFEGGRLDAAGPIPGVADLAAYVGQRYAGDPAYLILDSFLAEVAERDDSTALPVGSATVAAASSSGRDSPSIRIGLSIALALVVSVVLVVHRRLHAGASGTGDRSMSNFSMTSVLLRATSCAVAGFAALAVGTAPSLAVGYHPERAAPVSVLALDSDRVPSTVTLTMKNYSVSRTHHATVTAWVAAPGQFATGVVKVKEGKRVLKTKHLRADDLGHVTMKLPSLGRVGKHHLRVKYSGNDHVRPGVSEPKTPGGSLTPTV